MKNQDISAKWQKNGTQDNPQTCEQAQKKLYNSNKMALIDYIMLFLEGLFSFITLGWAQTSLHQQRHHGCN